MSIPSNTVLCFFLFAFSILPSVSGHGVVSRFVANGVTNEAWMMGRPQTDSAIRHVTDFTPMEGVNNPGINCGPGANQPATMVLDADPGSDINLHWGGVDGSKWPHNTGPMMAYMTSCEGDCRNFDSSSAQWFKIHQLGKKPNGEWFQQEIMNGQDAVVPLPRNIKAGQYLLHHEIIALHRVPSEGVAEFYASCVQINIGGSGTGVPQPDELVRLPGAYKQSDPGISSRDVYGNSNYVMPGPAIAAFVNGDVTSGADGAAYGAAYGGPDTTTTPTPTTRAQRTATTSKPASRTGCSRNRKRSGNMPRHAAWSRASH